METKLLLILLWVNWDFQKNQLFLSTYLIVSVLHVSIILVHIGVMTRMRLTATPYEYSGYITHILTELSNFSVYV